MVISSNWRDTHTLEALLAYFSEYIRSRVVGVTPTLDSLNREDEIHTVVREYGIRQWVALDDRAQEFPKTAATNLVVTEYLDCITARTLEQLTAMLRAHSPL